MQSKHIPVRKCSGCSEHKDKSQLVRIVKSPAGAIALDPTGKAPGRGAYLCPSADCLKAARKARRLERAFKSAIPAEVYETLEKQLAETKTDA
ncbi:MAG: YlxR family protein [Oscillospiraceae bacterium]|nr:YlxR family protein [Oscillospiraceae bacterium]